MSPRRKKTPETGADPAAPKAARKRKPSKAQPEEVSPDAYEAQARRPPTPDEEMLAGIPTDTLGEEVESRDRNPDMERSGRDALDDAEQMYEDDEELPLDAIDERAALPGAENFETRDSGFRAARSDDAEMGLGAEPHSADELAQDALGDVLKGRPGVRRDGDEHGERFLDRP
jgi:hypothetical protein